MTGRGWVCGALAFAAAGFIARAQGTASAAPLPPATPTKQAVRLHSEGSGRFEVLSSPGSDGARLAALADAAWTEWAGALGLPARLPTAIIVRLSPRDDWGFGEVPSRVVVDPAGIVSVWIRADGGSGVSRERLWLRALAEGVLRRKAVLLGLDPAKTRAPRWLAAAAAEAAVVAERPSMMDAWRGDFGGLAHPAGLREILLGEVADPVDANEARDTAAYGVWLWLRDESGKSGAWERFVGALLGGESSGAALAREFSRLTPRPREAREWELAWRVAAARFAFARTTPMFTAEESRRRLERLSRVVVMEARTGAERVLPPWGEWVSREEPWAKAVLAERAGIIEVDFTRFHPFYSNAAGSLGRAWSALGAGREKDWRAASVEWARDMEDGRVLENASRALLDQAEGR